MPIRTVERHVRPAACAALAGDAGTAYAIYKWLVLETRAQFDGTVGVRGPRS